jgi:hypothetical protein
VSKLKVQVSWPGSESKLLPDAGSKVELLAGGNSLTPSQSKRGLRVFDVPEGTTQLELKAEFTLSFGAVEGRKKGTIAFAAKSGVVLVANQKFTVAGAQLTAQTIPDYAGTHPLVVTRGAANKNGVVDITLRTEFVDIDQFWDHYAAGATGVRQASTSRIVTKVLGNTGGGPLIWLAMVPRDMHSHSAADASCLVFFRPKNYFYTRLDEHHEASAVGRYFLSPKRDPTPKYWEGDHCVVRPPPDLHYNLMRCGFEEAMDESLRAMVMLHPWPSGSGFGAATTGALPSLCEAAIRFLRAQFQVCTKVPDLHLGRLGIAAFSKGGEAMWPTLRNNMTKVQEVYAFDCNHSTEARGTIVQWANSHPSGALRLVGGAYNQGTYDDIGKTLSPSGKNSSLTIVLRHESVFKAGNQTVWDHYIKDTEFLRNHIDTRHQFAVCGGTMFGNTGPYDLGLVERFMTTFLKSSQFNKL